MSAWTRTKKIARWLLINGTWYLLGTLGTIAGVAWSFNIFAFLTWILCLMTAFLVFGVLAGKVMDTPIKIENNPAFSHWVDAITDGAMALILVAFGHWFYGFMIVCHILGYAFVLKEIKPSPQYPGSTNTPA